MNLSAPKGGAARLAVLCSEQALGVTSIREHLDVMGDLFFPAANILKSPTKFWNWFHKQGLDGLLFPNPYGNKARLLIYRRARALGLPVIVYDRGALPGSWFFDVGFNADSPSFRAQVWDQPLSEEAAQQVAEYVDKLTVTGDALEAQGSWLESQELRAKYGLGDRKVLFVPLQRPGDTVMQYFAGNLRDTDNNGHRSFAKFIAEIHRLSLLLKGAGDEWVILAKRHPLETTTPNCDVIWADSDEHINGLLELASSVLCVNSGVGLLALGFGCPVLHFGQAFYAHPKMTAQVRDADDVTARLAIGTPNICFETRDRFLSHLITKVYSFGTFRTRLETETGGALRRVTEGIDFEILRYPKITPLPRPKGVCLFISPVVPVRIQRGSDVRTAQMLDSLAASGYRVDLHLLNTSVYDANYEELEDELRRRFPCLRDVMIVDHPRVLCESADKERVAQGELTKKRTDVLRRIFYPFRKYRGVRTFDAQPVNFMFNSWKRSRGIKFDLIFSNYAKMTPPWLGRRNEPKIVDTHDVQADVFWNERAPRLKTDERRKVLGDLHAQTERYLLGLYDKVIAISSVDAASFQERYELGDKCVQINAAMPDLVRSNTPVDPNSILFVGSQSRPNIGALFWLCEDVLSKIPALPDRDLRLDIVGTVTHVATVDDLLAKGVYGSVSLNVRGVVPDLSKSYANAAVVLAPLTRGTGMKIKVVEAMAHAKAIIGTSVAFEGIPAVDGVHAIIKDDPEEFAAALTALLNAPEQRQKLEENARMLFEREFSQEGSNIRFSECLASLPKV